MTITLATPGDRVIVIDAIPLVSCSYSSDASKALSQLLPQSLLPM